MLFYMCEDKAVCSNFHNAQNVMKQGFYFFFLQIPTKLKMKEVR